MSDLALDTLEAKGLIRVAAISPELEYLFRHALLQDAAYESLLKQERRALHRLVGDALEALYPERHGELAAVLAGHYEQAGEAEKAIAYLLEAARFAGQRNALVEAYDMYGRAAALLPPREADDPPALRHRRLEIELGRLRAGFSFVEEATQAAMMPWLVAEADVTDDLALAAEVHIHVALLLSFGGARPDTNPDLAHSLERVAEVAEKLGDPAIGAVPSSLIGLFEVFSGQLERGVERLRQVAPLLADKRDFIGSAFAMVALAIGLARLGRFEEAARAAEDASQMAQDGDVIARLDALIGEIVVRSLRGDLDEAVRIGRQCIQMAEDSGAVACVISSSFFVGDALMRRGEFEQALEVLERSGAIAGVTDQKIFRPSIAAYVRSAAASLGNAEVSGLTFEEALAEAASIGDSWAEANIYWKRAESEAKRPQPDWDNALADFAIAERKFQAMGARPFVARTLRGWADALAAAGRSAEARATRVRAVAAFGELGLEGEAGEVRASLA